MVLFKYVVSTRAIPNARVPAITRVWIVAFVVFHREAPTAARMYTSGIFLTLTL